MSGRRFRGYRRTSEFHFHYNGSRTFTNTGQSCCGANAPRWSWIARILPYFEQEPLYKQANVSETTNLDANAAVIAAIGTTIPVLICPSDGTSNTFMIGEAIADMDIHTAWPYANTSCATCGIGPNAVQISGVTYGSGDWPNVYSFRSKHTGGMNFALADASVRFIATDNIPIATYRAMCSINGSEIVSLNQ